MNKQEAIDKMNEWLEENGVGKEVSYRLRDWLFSVNVTGEPIPIIHWEDGTVTAVPEEELPLRLPKTKHQAKRYWRISISKYRGVGQCR